MKVLRSCLEPGLCPSPSICPSNPSLSCPPLTSQVLHIPRLCSPGDGAARNTQDVVSHRHHLSTTRSLAGQAEQLPAAGNTPAAAKHRPAHRVPQSLPETVRDEITAADPLAQEGSATATQPHTMHKAFPSAPGVLRRPPLLPESEKSGGALRHRSPDCSHCPLLRFELVRVAVSKTHSRAASWLSFI